MPSLMPIWPVDTSAEFVGEVAQREWVTDVKLHLEKRLSPVGSE